ncbi:monovalent cation/H+ antiporter complex subunit F [Celeribacter ethanolicus]|uniref:Cation:proton antiporter n=1 Tax=Celeribacter ethanolicus TaxID=1758178 RepID=A0A291G7W1_9RHOB|nr:monovalent cation/H+ antiporter complex subunit F [Celeribacter ethanolicus]ATG46247.1 cation:proton antiporter [Celeribacter ethanolicus]
MADLLLSLAALIAAVAFGLAAWRFIKGPRATDRVVAFDALTIISVTGIVLAALITGRSIYLDVALVYALLSFLGVITAARYLEGGEE